MSDPEPPTHSKIYDPTALLLVHGILSSAETWKDVTRIVRADADIRHCALINHEYDSRFFNVNPTRRIPSISDLADSFGNHLDQLRGSYRSIVILTHSQGGLVVQRYLHRQLSEGKGATLGPIRAIILVACPNNGSEFALSLRRAFRIWRHAQERELRPLAEEIVESQRTVINRVVHAAELGPNSWRIPIIAVAGASDNVVTPASARSVFPDATTVPGDHFDIHHPTSPNAQIYSTIKRVILQHTRAGQVGSVETGMELPASNTTASFPEASANSTTDRYEVSGNRLSPSTSFTSILMLVQALEQIPGMTSPSFREEVYDMLPLELNTQISRQRTTRTELLGLIRTFTRYPHLHPWTRLDSIISALVGDHQPSVLQLREVLRDLPTDGEWPAS